MIIGTKQLTADGLVDSTNGTRIYSVLVKSAGTAAVVAFKSGSASGNELFSVNGTINQTVLKEFPGGLLFSSGCYIDVDANTTYVTVSYEREG